MTENEAYRIFNLPPGTGADEIKRKYRQLITQVHPDIHGTSKNGYAYTAQEINIAYSVLKKRIGSADKALYSTQKKDTKKEEKASAWDAPVNEHAYMEREILHYAEDYDGTILGNFCIAKGKYLWKSEEDFPLFLLSIYKCGKSLLDEIDTMSSGQKPSQKSSTIRPHIQAELTYLLAQQFIDGTSLLKEFMKEESIGKDDGRTFYTAAMLEAYNPPISLKADETLCPSRLSQHKLYLKNQSGQELGYLSFPDDRLYYIVVPLFEQKKVRVKIKAVGNQAKKGRKATIPYHNLHLWINLPCTTPTTMPENLNLQIEGLLERYKNML